MYWVGIQILQFYNEIPIFNKIKSEPHEVESIQRNK